MASAVNPVTSSGDTTQSSQQLGTKPPTEQMFLQLLVAQLKNQDPMNPTDGTQFVSQLAQFSELEQVIGIRGDIETYHAAATATTTDPGTQAGSGNTNTNNTTGTTNQ